MAVSVFIKPAFQGMIAVICRELVWDSQLVNYEIQLGDILALLHHAPVISLKLALPAYVHASSPAFKSASASQTLLPRIFFPLLASISMTAAKVVSLYFGNVISKGSPPRRID